MTITNLIAPNNSQRVKDKRGRCYDNWNFELPIWRTDYNSLQLPTPHRFFFKVQRSFSSKCANVFFTIGPGSIHQPRVFSIKRPSCLEYLSVPLWNSQVASSQICSFGGHSPLFRAVLWWNKLSQINMK